MTLWNKHAQHQTWIPFCICDCTLRQHRCQCCAVFEPSNHPSSHSPTFEAFEIFTTFTPKTTRRFTPRYTYLGWVNGFGEKGEANVKQLTLTMISGLKINEKVPGFWKTCLVIVKHQADWVIQCQNQDSTLMQRVTLTIWLRARNKTNAEKLHIWFGVCIYIYKHIIVFVHVVFEL